MHPIAPALKVLFRHLPTARLCEVIHDPLQEKYAQPGPLYQTDLHLFTAALSQQLPSLIEESRENIFRQMQEMIYMEHGNEIASKGLDPFHLLRVFGQMHLTYGHPDPQVKYKRLLSWREVILELGEDLFTCAFLASEDAKRNQKRAYFTWKPTLATDNQRLQRMLGQGMAENHYHLYGSAPHFLLSWLNLMNFPTGRWKAFRKAGMTDARLKTDAVHDPRYRPQKLYQLVKLAALIRARLFLLLKEGRGPLSGGFKGNYPPERLFEMLKNPDAIDLFYHDEAQLIASLRMEFGHRLAGEKVIDYAIRADFDEVNRNPNLPLMGERELIYHFLRSLYQKDEATLQHQGMFHLYLLIKSRFRTEMVQANGKSGFKNFLHYQDRKKAFVKDQPFWWDLLRFLCLKSNLQYDNLQSLEARIIPKETPDLAADEIAELDHLEAHFPLHPDDLVKLWLHSLFPSAESREDSGLRHFYVYHFIKKLQKPTGQIRNSKVRKEVKRQAQAVYDLRKKAAPEAGRIYGIDAAGMEMVSRPEVFAHAFRYLRAHSPEFHAGTHLHITHVSPLRITFHAGEDFIDLADGLRMIDEAITFLHMCQGDRLGHALAMGQDVEQYYQYRNSRITCTRQMLMDNLAWMLHQLGEYGFPQIHLLRPELEREFGKQFSKVYPIFYTDDHQHSPLPIHELYFRAWCLRADDPELYRIGHFIDQTPITNWEHHAKCPNLQLDVLRKDRTVARLYHQYHWDENAARRSEEQAHFKTGALYHKAIRFLQEKMMRDISAKGIAIETNPTSNFLIGAFRRYSQHPIFRFYNRELPQIPGKYGGAPQMFVSINTDDIGVFSTNLETEFALLALALEKETDDNGESVHNRNDIYEYLDSIRKMGLQMSFREISST